MREIWLYNVWPCVNKMNRINGQIFNKSEEEEKMADGGEGTESPSSDCLADSHHDKTCWCRPV